ncbi:RNA polymerase sigma-70 factor [Bacteroides faecis]
MIENLFRSYYSMLRSYAFRLVNDFCLAEDIVQDVFMSLWNNRNNIDFDSELKPYLFRAIYNKSLDYLKSKKCTEEESLDTIIARLELSHHSNENHEETLFAKEIQQEIVNYLKGQPENVRKVFVLSRYHGLKIKEIARQLELSQKTVEKYLSRVLKGLKECLIYKELLSFLLIFSFFMDFFSK